MIEHDDPGAWLRTALQEISPLASDPVPPPLFLAVDTTDDGDVIDLVDAGGPARRPRRRPAVVGAVLLAAAVAAGLAVAVADVAGTSAVPATTASPSPAVTPSQQDAISLDGAIWRCTAPAGTVLGYAGVVTGSGDATYSIAAGVRCGPVAPADAVIVVHPDGHVGVVTPEPAGWGGSPRCTAAESQVVKPLDGSTSIFSMTPASGAPAVVGRIGPSGFVSRGDRDYLEFYGTGCRLVIAASAVRANPGVPTPTVTTSGFEPWAATDFSETGRALGTEVWRCTAPAGTTLRAVQFEYHGVAEDDWFVGAGATCAPVAAGVSSLVVGPDGKVEVRDPHPVNADGSDTCRLAESQQSDFPTDMDGIPSAGPHGVADGYSSDAFDSRGAQDYIDFAGPGCRVSFPSA